jgi:hypothetical protein
VLGVLIGIAMKSQHAISIVIQIGLEIQKCDHLIVKVGYHSFKMMYECHT